MTRCFEVKLGSQEEAVTYQLSPNKIRPSPWPDTVWNPRNEPFFTTEGRFTDSWRKNVSNLWMLIRPEVEALPNVIGEFIRTRSSPAAVDENTKKTIEEMNTELCDFIPVGKIWDKRFERQVDAPRFYFTSVRRSLECWDRAYTEITEMQRADGTTHCFANPPLVVRGSVIESELLWRDGTTGHVLCTGAFKTKIEASGALGFWFYEIGVDAVLQR